MLSLYWIRPCSMKQELGPYLQGNVKITFHYSLADAVRYRYRGTVESLRRTQTAADVI